MTTATDLQGPLLGGIYVPPPSGKAPSHLVVFMHGYGADAQDLAGLIPMFSQQLPDAWYVSLEAPERCEMAPQGRQWFSLRHHAPDMVSRNPQEALKRYESMLPLAEPPAIILNRTLALLLAQTGLTRDKLILVGFSQGTVMALQVALRHATPVAGVIGFSGGLLGAATVKDYVVAKPPVIMIHGDADPMVPNIIMEHSCEMMQEAGINVRAILRPGLGHAIDEPGLQAAFAFLREITA